MGAFYCAIRRSRIRNEARSLLLIAGDRAIIVASCRVAEARGNRHVIREYYWTGVKNEIASYLRRKEVIKAAFGVSEEFFQNKVEPAVFGLINGASLRSGQR